MLMQYRALPQMVSIHPHMAAKRAGLIGSQAKHVKINSQEVMAGGQMKAGRKEKQT